MDKIVEVRSLFFELLGKYWVTRFMMISLFISAIWCFADYRTGNLKDNFWDNVICFGFAVFVEFCLPWGKEKNQTKKESL